MSYALVVAPDAQAGWLNLEIRFQEMILDAADLLCSSPPDDPDTIVDLVLKEGPVRHYLFIHALLDHRRQVVILVGIGHGRLDDTSD